MLGEYMRHDFFGGSEDVARAREALKVWRAATVRPLNAGELEPEKAPRYVVQFCAQHLKEANAGLDDFMELVEDGWCRAWEAYEPRLAVSHVMFEGAGPSPRGGLEGEPAGTGDRVWNSDQVRSLPEFDTQYRG